MQSLLSTIGFWTGLGLACAWLLPRYYYAHGAQRAAELRRATATMDAFVLLSLLLPWIPASRGGPVTGITVLFQGNALFAAFALSVAIALILLCTTRQAILLKSAASMQILATFLLFVAMLRMLPGNIVISSLTETAPFAAALLLLCSNVAVLLLWHQIQHTETMDRNPQDDKNRKMRYNRIKSKSNSMHKYLRKKTAITAAAFGFAAVLTAASAVTFHTFRAAVSDGLIGIRINADGPLSMEAGGSLRLTAEGDYGTMTMPVQARWSTHGDAAVTLAGCKKAKECTVTAGEDPGVTEIEAEAEEYSATVMVEITEILRNPFTDDVPSWALPSVLHMHKLGVIKGYDDGRFGAGDSMTHGQVVTLLTRILQHANLTRDPQNCSQVYEDVPSPHYAFQPACLFEQQGWADPAPRLEADAAAPRAAVARFVHRVLGKTIPTVPSPEQIFDDVPTSHLSFADTAFTNATGIMTGNPSGDFGVQEPVNRAAGAVVMARVLDTIENREVKALEGYRPAAPQQSSAPSPASSSPSSAAGTVSCGEIAGKSFAQASDGDITAYVSDYGLYVCVGNERMARVVHDTYSGVNFPSVAGRKVVYFKEYGINVYDVDTQAVTEAEPKQGGANMPTSAGDYAAYFKDYGIVVYHLPTGKKTQVEPANSGCNDPKLDGMTLRYRCNYKSKTFDLRVLEEGSQMSSSSTPSSVSAPPSIPPPAGSTSSSSAASSAPSTASSITATTSAHAMLPASAPAGEHYGFFSISGKNFYDVSSDALEQENALPPYDILFEQNRAGDLLTISTPEGERTAMAEIVKAPGVVGTTVTSTTYGDCTKALQEGKKMTSVTLAQEDGRAVCVLTEDGFVSVLEYAESPGTSADIRYRLWVPGKVTDITGERGETLSPANLLSYDFSEGSSLPVTDRTYDLWIMRDYNGGNSTITLQQNTQNLITMYPSSRNFETTGIELCKRQLTFAPQQWSGNKLTLSGKSDAICFQTNDGFIGKIGNMSDAAFTVQYALWPAPVWEFLPEYQPGETPY